MGRSAAVVALLTALLLSRGALETFAAFSAVTQNPGNAVQARLSFRLTQPATAACISDTGTGGCTDGTGLDQPEDIAVSPDGAHAYVASAMSEAVTVFARNASTGVLTQLAGTAGCVSESGSSGVCAEGDGLPRPTAVAVSPDGRHVYVTSREAGGVASFARNASTGALTQLAGTAGCTTVTGSFGECGVGTALDGAEALALSPTGAHLYAVAATDQAVVTFARNATTGVLTQLAGTAGCTSETGTGGACADGVALNQPEEVVVSADGRHLYLTSRVVDALVAFSRNTTTGVLTQLPGTAACVSETGSGGVCADGRALAGPEGLAISPGDGHLYVGSTTSDAVAAFARNGTTGAVTQLAGVAGCLSADGTGGTCGTGVALDGAEGVAVSPDGQDVYVASEPSDAVAVFARDAVSGALTQAPGTARCISETGSGGTCADGAGLDGAQAVTVSPDGADVYVASFNDAVARFTRTR